MAVTEANDATIRKILIQHERAVVKYYADWCGSCRLQASHYEAMSEEERYRNMLFLKVNSEYNPLARRLVGVHDLPFFACFDRGELLFAFACREAEEMRKELNQMALNAGAGH
jgi:thiol-disulfide isomerase/thioredoxin